MSYYTSSYGGGAYPGRAYTAGASYASQPAAYSAQPAAYSAQPAYQTRGYTAQTPSYSTYQPSTASQVPSASSRYSSYTSASTAATPQVYRYPMGADPRTTTTPYASQYTAGQSTRASATPAATASATSAAPGVQRTRLATEVPKASNNPQTTYVPRPTTTTSKPAAKAPSAQAKVEEVEEISTPAAKAADDVEVLDADRDKVFDALFEAQVQVCSIPQMGCTKNLEVRTAHAHWHCTCHGLSTRTLWMALINRVKSSRGPTHTVVYCLSVFLAFCWGGTLG